MQRTDIDSIATALIDAYDGVRTLPPISATRAGFDAAAAYDVLHAIEARRHAQGWTRCGRKVGFTNRTLWARYGVDRPMWAHVWTRTVHQAASGAATLALAHFVQPRIEPEVVFGLAGPVHVEGDARRILDAVAWIAPGFEIVQSHFPDWKFTAADCTAAFGLHGALVVGPRTPLDDRRRDALAAALPLFSATLSQGERVVDRGVGANVLDSPALALRHLAQVLATQPQFPPLKAGEVITTGTLTDAWPVTPGQTWSSDYGELGLPPLRLTLA
ncbi:MAG: fumarylacetoacetate hydrolase family protein [Betaproteobacteria bacterium]